MPIVQRRSKPVKGSVVAFVAGVVAVGVVLVVAGAVVLFGLLLSFDGNVPVEGFGVVVVMCDEPASSRPALSWPASS